MGTNLEKYGDRLLTWKCIFLEEKAIEHTQKK